MITIKHIKNINDLYYILSDQKYYAGLERYRSPFLYRGLPNESYSLATSLQRNCKHKQSDVELPILRNFTKYSAIADLRLNESVWRQMTLGQHHGLPTRLLDWTYSPLMGLHFSTSGENMEEMGRHNCVLWKIDIEEFNNLLPHRYHKKLQDEQANLFTIEMLSSVVNTIAQYDTDMKQDSMVLLEPPSIDDRIVNQYSYFSIVPAMIDNIEAFLNTKTSHTVKYIIDKDLRWRIRDMLDQMNINERIAYPGLDGISAWIKRRYFVK